MTTIETPVRSKTILQGDPAEPALRMAAQLLGEAGHIVDYAGTPESALPAAGHADLLVLSIPDAAARDHWLDRIALLPAAERPRRLAVLLTDDAESLPLSRRRSTDLPVTVLTRSVHAVGLLNLIKRMTTAAH